MVRFAFVRALGASLWLNQVEQIVLDLLLRDFIGLAVLMPGQGFDGLQICCLGARCQSPELHVLDHSLSKIFHFHAPSLETIILRTHRRGTLEGA